MWVTILKRDDNKKKTRFIGSVQFQFAISYIAIIAGLLIVLNTYPLIGSRDLVFQAKESTLKGQAQIVAASLSEYDELSAESVNYIISALDIAEFTRTVVVDGECKIMYDTSDGGSNVGTYALFSEITTAMNGYDVFHSQFSGGAFMSKVAIPIVSASGENKYTIGAVYIFESDTEQANLILAMQNNLRNISLVISVISVLVAVLFSNTLTRRIKALLKGINQVSDGDYNYRITVKGNDELSALANEFNGLTDRLKRTEEMRRRFVSDASHELKTPLASINLLSDSIVQNKDMSMDTVRDFVNDIGQEALRLTRTTEKLLSLTRLDSIEEHEGRVLVDIGAVANSALHMLKPLADKNGVFLITDIKEGKYVLSTEDDLYQIVFNLAENGIKYNIIGGNLSVILKEVDGEIRLVFEDTGIGIPEEDVPHVFERFYRVDKARSRELGGSGLGLSIVKDTVLAHNGQVEVATRTSGRGSRFTVSFPAFVDPDEQMVEEKKLEAQEDGIIDDLDLDDTVIKAQTEEAEERNSEEPSQMDGKVNLDISQIMASVTTAEDQNAPDGNTDILEPQNTDETTSEDEFSHISQEYDPNCDYDYNYDEIFKDSPFYNADDRLKEQEEKKDESGDANE